MPRFVAWFNRFIMLRGANKLPKSAHNTPMASMAINIKRGKRKLIKGTDLYFTLNPLFQAAWKKEYMLNCTDKCKKTHRKLECNDVVYCRSNGAEYESLGRHPWVANHQHSVPS
jgi:hypothetical protein